MIKVLAPALKHPSNRALEHFQRYWAVSHGPLFANTRNLRRYVQHLTLPEAYGHEPEPTFDGVSMFWYDSLDAVLSPSQEPRDVALREAVRSDDAQLFDRIDSWPRHHKRASIAAEEHVILDGETTPEMVKAIFIASRLPGLTLGEFFDHWLNVHGPLGAKVPGLRRYVQNHGLREAYAVRDMTHDGWSELWFDDLAALQKAQKSKEWTALRHDGRSLFTYPMGVGVARELVQKEIDVPVRRWGAAELSEDEIRSRLSEQGYKSLAADPKAPARIKAADAAGALAVWTDEHLVTFDDSRIDARPSK